MKFDFKLVFFFLFLTPKIFFSQNTSSFSSNAEKIYLQLDNKVYTTDQTVWFKSIITDAGDHSLSELSGILYTELIDPYENIIEKKLIKIEQGLGQGFFQLSPLYTHGIYQVRAYTEWNKNFGDRFVFKTYILVSGKQRPSEFNLIKSLTVINDQQKGRQLKVELNPDINDSISGKTVSFILEADDKRDTLSLRKNKSNQYLLDKRIAEQTEIVSIHVETENQTSYSKTIILDTNYLDVQFFPEGGELVQGLPAVLGYKILDYTGKGKQASGRIINNAGETVTSFTSNFLGMGIVRINKIDKATGYKIKIATNDGTEVLKEFRFPDIADNGIILSVEKQNEKILIKAVSNYILNDSIIIRASSRGRDYYDFKGVLKNGSFAYSFNSSSLPEGIIAFTLLIGEIKLPIAERLYFNQQKAERLAIKVATDKSTYVQREQSNIDIETKDESGKPVEASVSLLVIDNSLQGTTNDYRSNILSYFLLSSELKGVIESPGYYFENDMAKFKELEALLLTQGWSKYNYQADTGIYYFQPERNIAVTGFVKGGLTEKKTMKGAKLTMMAFGKPAQADEQKTDSLGRFRFILKDDYSQNLPVLIQSANKSSKKVSYLVTLDKKVPPPVQFDHYKKIDKPDSIEQVYVQQSLANQKILDSIRIAAEGVTLQEVIVKSRVLSPEQKAVTDRFGEAKTILTGDQIRAKEAKWSYGLYSVLMFNFPDKVRVTKYGNGFMYASLYNAEPTLVVIDGIPVRIENYSSIPIIPPSEVKSFELIPYANDFHALFCEEVYCGINTPSVGNVIAIYTFAGKGLFGVSPTIGMNKMEIPVFAPTREFYAPKYEQLKPEDWQKPDLRTLIHWQPMIVTDTLGKTSTSFYNGDITGNMKVVVEAITADGRIGYKELFYEVKKK